MINEKKKKNRKGLTFRTSIPLENRRVGMDSKFRRKKICIVDYFTNGRERERENRNWFKVEMWNLFRDRCPRGF